MATLFRLESGANPLKKAPFTFHMIIIVLQPSLLFFNLKSLQSTSWKLSESPRSPLQPRSLRTAVPILF